MLYHLPNEVLESIFLFLTNDGPTLGRLSLCSRDLYQRIARDNPEVWRTAVHHRWSIHSQLEEDETNEDHAREKDPRTFYIHRHLLDQEATHLLDRMTKDLKRVLKLEKDKEGERLDGKFYVGQAWDHVAWNRLLDMRGDIMEGLQKRARLSLPTEGQQPSFDERLGAFVAARSLQALQLARCLQEWKAIVELEDQKMIRDSRNQQHHHYGPNVDSCRLVERYALLVNEIQQTPEQLILRQDVSIKPLILRTLDDLANHCKERIRQEEATRELRTIDKISIVSTYLFQDQNFSGNTDDYYNYRNSLLDQVLETRKGIPITLAILLTSVCRRLNIPVHVIGLPGHVVSGFWTEDGERHFVDVFHNGNPLSLEDCQRICEPYEHQYLGPLSPDKVLQRILNNLANTHLTGMASLKVPFHSDLYFQQRALSSIHRQPRDIAGQLIDRVTKELPFTLSPDLLRFYKLLSP